MERKEEIFLEMMDKSNSLSWECKNVMKFRSLPLLYNLQTVYLKLQFVEHINKNVNMYCLQRCFNFPVLSSWTTGKCLPWIVNLDFPSLRGQNLKKRQECKSKLIAWNNLKNLCVANDAFDIPSRDWDKLSIVQMNFNALFCFKKTGELPIWLCVTVIVCLVQ